MLLTLRFATFLAVVAQGKMVTRTYHGRGTFGIRVETGDFGRTAASADSNVGLADMPTLSAHPQVGTTLSRIAQC
jgi:hypothetical protein